MSSEEEARIAVLRDVRDIQLRAYANGKARLLSPDEPLRLDKTANLLDDLTAAIEQRVLAQQPCYGSWPTAIEALERMLALGGKSKLLRKPGGNVTCLEQATHSPDEAIPLCPTCTARQTQETSG